MPKLAQQVVERLKELPHFNYEYAKKTLIIPENIEKRSPTLLQNGSVYIGEWDIESNKRYGRAKMIFRNGALFEGYVINNRVNGYGRHIKPDGEFYIGYWKDDALHGKGNLVNANGSSYQGEWQRDR